MHDAATPSDQGDAGVLRRLRRLGVIAMLADRAASPHDAIYWEMGRQTAVRRGPWKLVLHGQLVEGAPPDDEIFLADLANDPAEHTNLRERQPELAAELR